MVTRARVVLARCVAVDGFGCLFSHIPPVAERVLGWF